MLQLINKLHLDVAGGAVIVSLWLAKLFDVAVQPPAVFILGMTVWCIYTLDHLLDARKYASNPSLSPNRYTFYHTYQKPLKIALTLGLASIVFFLPTLSHDLLISGAILGSICGLYLLLSNFGSEKNQHLKSIPVAIIYTMGVSLFILPKAWGDSIPVVLAWLLMLALSSLAMYAYLEWEEDQAIGMISEQIMERQVVGFAAGFCIMMSYFLLAIIAVLQDLPLQFYIPALLMVTLTACLPLIKGRHRPIGEAVFWIPLTSFWF